MEEDVSLFDAPAFNISQLEAKVSNYQNRMNRLLPSADDIVNQAMDPQMRMLLEVAYEALENGKNYMSSSRRMVAEGVLRRRQYGHNSR